MDELEPNKDYYVEVGFTRKITGANINIHADSQYCGPSKGCSWYPTPPVGEWRIMVPPMVPVHLDLILT